MGTDSFTYDANGNQATRNVGGNSYALSYDAENRTKNVQVTRLVGVSGAATASYVYDGDGTRVKGTIGSTTTTYIGNYFEWKTSTSDMIRYYYAGNTRVAMRIGGSTLNYLLGDHLGSTSITTDSDGSRTAEIRYYPWGTERYTYQTTPTSYHFTGQRLESEIGLYFYGARWYDAELGRFIQADSIVAGGVQGLDRYSYVGSNPIINIDPSGFITQSAACGPDGIFCDPERTIQQPWYSETDSVDLNYWGQNMVELLIELHITAGWWNNYGHSSFTADDFLILILGFEFSPYDMSVLNQLNSGEGYGYDLAHATSHGIRCSPNPSTNNCSNFSNTNLSANVLLNYIGSRDSARIRWIQWNRGSSLESLFLLSAQPNLVLATAVVNLIYDPPEIEWLKGDDFSYKYEPSDWGNDYLYKSEIAQASQGTLCYQYMNRWGWTNFAYILSGCQSAYWHN